MLDEGWVVNMIIDLSKRLKNMHTFDWDGLELPEDELWNVLRVNCPQLKSIFTNVGTRPLEPPKHSFLILESHKFLFDRQTWFRWIGICPSMYGSCRCDGKGLNAGTRPSMVGCCDADRCARYIAAGEYSSEFGGVNEPCTSYHGEDGWEGIIIESAENE